jgi:oligopeptide/dipeptide ABC transporter ATP-binding protein
MANETLLQTVGLKKYYQSTRGINPLSRTKSRTIRAVDGVDLSIPYGRTLAVVGESGCGKTTLARTIALLQKPTSGEIHFDGERVDDRTVDLRNFYRKMQMVFQDPDSSLDPRMKVGDSVAEPLRGLTEYGDVEIRKASRESLNAVGLSEDFANRLPKQLSGGQKQMVAIARAISTRPKLLILDEPTSALDASVQAQILNLLVDLQRKFNLSYMLITHNIAVAAYLSDFIAVMYAGNVVEHGPGSEILRKPRHPYTITLMKSAPAPDPWNRTLLQTEISGEVPSAIAPPSGCKFHPRCPYAEEVCSQKEPMLEEIERGHLAACHFVDKTA